eukprot:3290487-Rhodomonas_salina.1
MTLVAGSTHPRGQHWASRRFRVGRQQRARSLVVLAQYKTLGRKRVSRELKSPSREAVVSHPRRARSTAWKSHIEPMSGPDSAERMRPDDNTCAWVGERVDERG